MSKTLEETVHDILFDFTFFPIGCSYTFKEISKIVLPLIKQNPQFLNETDKNIEHHISKVLQVHNNNRDNDFYTRYENTCTRDISKVKISPNRCQYTFGCSIN